MSRAKAVQGQHENSGSLFPVFLSLLLLVAGVVLSLSLFDLVMEKFDKPITRVVIQGDLVHLNREDVIETVDIYETDTFLKLDLNKVRQGLEENPWIYRASIGRQWPGTIEIHIQEQQPIAVWNDESYLNNYGEVFDAGDITVEGLPGLAGVEGSEQMLVAHYQSFSRQAALIGLSVKRVAYEEKGHWDITLDNGVRVLLGKEDVLERMARFAALFGTALAGRQEDVERVDMRYDGGAAVGWKGSASGVQANRPGMGGKAKQQSDRRLI